MDAGKLAGKDSMLLCLVLKINLVFLLLLMASAFVLPLTDKESLTVVLVAGLLFGINLALIQRFRGKDHPEVAQESQSRETLSNRVRSD